MHPGDEHIRTTQLRRAARMNAKAAIIAAIDTGVSVGSFHDLLDSIEASRQHDYHVEWEIDLSASSSVAAAEDALKIMRDPDAKATVFRVTDEHGSTASVDLETGVS